MSTNLEIESKAMITKEGYETLLKTLQNNKNYKQINYYFSSAKLDSKSENIGLRIRKKNHRFELTLKVKTETGNIEINQEIGHFSYIFCKYFGIFPKGEVYDNLLKNNLFDRSIKIIGKLITKRTDIEYNGSLISIDKSSYNGVVDYEIECEDIAKEKANLNLESFLKECKIEYKKSEHTKLARFRNSL